MYFVLGIRRVDSSFLPFGVPEQLGLNPKEPHQVPHLVQQSSIHAYQVGKHIMENNFITSINAFKAFTSTPSDSPFLVVPSLIGHVHKPIHQGLCSGFATHVDDIVAVGEPIEPSRRALGISTHVLEVKPVAHIQ